jgi:predicted RNA-binding protein YlxR (DUF448 family)
MIAVRTCLGCRERAERSTLLRIIARDGEVVVDMSAKLFGRGAWVHPTAECVEASIKRKAIGRALRSNVFLDTRQLLTHVLSDQCVHE